MSFLALLATTPYLLKFRIESSWLTLFCAFVGLLIWERISVVFPVSSFTLYGNSDFALKAISRAGLDLFRILLMGASVASGFIWWKTSSRSLFFLPGLMYLVILWQIGTQPSTSTSFCANCFPVQRNIELVQLRDGTNGGTGLKGGDDKIQFVKDLPAVGVQTWTVWPEGAFDQIDSQTPQFEELIAEMSSQPNRIHFFGGIRRHGEIRTPTTFVVDAMGLVAEQGKVRPFPIGESSPFPEFMVEWGLVAEKVKVIKPATSHEAIILSGEPDFVFLTFICSDALDESYVKNQLEKAKKMGRTPVVIQILNDAWFDGTHEPVQHSEVVRLWAASLGVYWLRAGMTGQTQIISPYGKILVGSTDSSRQIVQGQLGPCERGSTGQCLGAEMKESNAQ